MKACVMRMALRVPAIAVAGVIGCVLPASMAAAQTSPAPKTESNTPADKPGTVGGLVVQAPRPPSKLGAVPPEKAAGYDKEAAKSEAWKRYRKSRPPLSAGTLGQADDYPGLQTLLPEPDKGAAKP
ncbi:MAG: hypothetical protein ACXWKY_08475 [Caulobacteraceae bacterium]